MNRGRSLAWPDQAADSHDHRGNSRAVHLNKAVTVKFGPNGATDVARYRYAINDDAPGGISVSPSAPRVTTTSRAFGPWSVRAWSYDQAGNQSAEAKVTLQVAATPPIGSWPFDEGTGLSQWTPAETTG